MTTSSADTTRTTTIADKNEKNKTTTTTTSASRKFLIVLLILVGVVTSALVWVVFGFNQVVGADEWPSQVNRAYRIEEIVVPFTTLIALMVAFATCCCQQQQQQSSSTARTIWSQRLLRMAAIANLTALLVYLVLFDMNKQEKTPMELWLLSASAGLLWMVAASCMNNNRRNGAPTNEDNDYALDLPLV
eukprot:CAMPEP_0198154318 /NCGR_PEP_ID=MMETSP1443-20131203/68175_1 /TAXON_ID=186043 /ORGANISM="Entomoneis sp., Strain CCMP2396" /LENGTH=188 /DNA_ID=CAMNT_0043820971 /DNA_START=6 /DNA_END=572 /DNA_ORIENTATION=-